MSWCTQRFFKMNSYETSLRDLYPPHLEKFNILVLGMIEKLYVNMIIFWMIIFERCNEIGNGNSWKGQF